MPLTKKQFAEIVAALGPDAPKEMVLAVAREAEKKLPDFSPGPIPAPPEPPKRLLHDLAVPAALRVVPAIAGGIAGAAGGGVLAPVGAAAGGAIGELLAEAYEKAAGTREEISPGQVALQGGLSAIPGLRGVGPLRRLAHGAAVGAAGTGATELVEGRTPTAPQLIAGAVGGAVPAALLGSREVESNVLRAFREKAKANINTPLADADLAEAAVAHTARSLSEAGGEEGGATVSRFYGDLLGKPRFAVSTFPDRTRKVDELTPEVVKDFIEANQDLLSERNKSLGIWARRGMPTDLDVVKTPRFLIDAVLSGKNANQEAIFDLRRKRTIPLDQPTLKILLNEGLIGDTLRKIRGERGSVSLTGSRPRTGARVGQNDLPFSTDDTLRVDVPKQDQPTVGQVPPSRISTLPNQPFPEPSVLDELYRAGEGAAKWYDNTKDTFVRILGEERAEEFLKALAATSPNASVRANVQLAIKALEQAEAGEEFSGFLGNVIKDLRRARKGDSFGGLKVQNFAKALLGDPDAVVVDRWVMRAFGFPEGKAPSPKVYNKIANIIRERAKALGVEPRQYQAALWKAAKDRAGRPGDTTAPFEQVFEEVAAWLWRSDGLLSVLAGSVRIHQNLGEYLQFPVELLELLGREMLRAVSKVADKLLECGHFLIVLVPALFSSGANMHSVHISGSKPRHA